MPTVKLSPIPLATVPVYDRTRDEFAMAALTGLLASNARGGLHHSSPFAVAAEAAYAFADAMLKQREAS
jgi:hypothetical protein